MIVGILSDTHDQQASIQRALAAIDQHRPVMLFFCGDATQVESVQWFSEYPLIYTFGNCDLLKEEIQSFIKALNKENFAGDSYQGEVFGKKIGMIHGDMEKALTEMVNSGQFDYIFTGHTHQRMDKRIGRTRVINPGALGGLKKESRSLAFLDLEKDDLQFEIIPE